jgi:hypothetical protein
MAQKRITLEEIGRRVDAVRLRQPFGFIGVQTSIRELHEGQGVQASVSGCISMQHWGMELGVNTRWRPESDTYIKDFLASRNVGEPGIIVMAEDASRHEFGHPKYCPISFESYTFIKNAIAVELQALGIISEDSIAYTANAFMDWIDNANVRARGQGEGLTIFYYTQGDSAFFSSFIRLNLLTWGDDADRGLIEKKFAMNLDSATRDQVEKSAAAFAYSAGLLERTPSGIREKTFQQKMDVLNDTDKWEALARLFVRTFGKMIKHKEGDPSPAPGGQQGSAQNPKPGAETPKPETGKQPQGGKEGDEGDKQEGEGEDGQTGQSGKPGAGIPKPGTSTKPDAGKKSLWDKWRDIQKKRGKDGKGEKGKDEGKGANDSAEGKDSQDGEPGQGGQGSKNDAEDEAEGAGDEGDTPGKHMGKFHEQSGKPSGGSNKSDKVDEPGTSAGENPFDKEAQTDEGMRKAVEATLKAGKGLPKFMDPDEAIDIYYQMVAKPVPIKSSSRCHGMTFPAIPFGAKEFDPERDDPEMVSGIRINADGTRGLEAYSDVLDVNAPVVDKLVSHPDVCLIIDSSGSMQSGGGSTEITSQKGNAAWGDRSSYHYALKSAHGIRNSLHSNGILPFIRMNVIIFSSSTTSTGWQDYAQGSAGRTAMAKPLFGGTTLDADELEKQLGSKEPSVVILISDGAIDNWARDKTRIMQTLSRHFVALLRIGPETPTSKDMKEAGFRVEPVTSDADLEKTVIDVTDQMYTGIGARQALESDWLVPK